MSIINIYSVYFISWMLLCEFIGHLKYRNTTIRNTGKYRKFVVISFVVIFGALMAFRNEVVGTDTYAYKQVYKVIANIDNPIKYRQFFKFPVYVIICRLLSYVSKDPQILVIATGFCIVGLNGLVIYSESRDPVFSVYLYISLNFYMYAFNITRQHLAMSLLLIAYLCLKKEHIKTAVIFILFATGVHNVAIVGFLLLPLYVFKPRLRTVEIYTSMAILYSTIGISLVGFFTKIFKSYTNITNAGFSLTKADSSGNRMYIAFFLIALELAGFYLLKENKWEDADKEEFIRLACFSNFGVFSMIFLRNYYIFSRIEGFFTQYLIVLIPLIYAHPFFRKIKKFVKLITYILLFIPYVTKLNNYLPYSTFWQ